MNTYTATFSTGKTVTRKSEHEYQYAVALVKKSTGKIGKVTFTASATPAPDWTGGRSRSRPPSSAHSRSARRSAAMLV